MAALPLSGIRVLDLTQVYAGPTCTRILCDLGAEVIKLEGLKRTDITHLLVIADNDSHDDFWNRMGYFLYRNAGKKSLTLDFSEPDAVELLKRLIPHADVVAESFTPRVMAQHGLDYESLRKIRPDLIMISLSGYGQSGPWRDYAAYGMGLEPASGISSLTGYRGGEPLRTGIAFTDPYSGIAGAGAVLTALHYRRRTGKGQYIDLSEQEAAIPVCGYALMDYAFNGREPERIGNRSPWFAPQGCYPCRGEDNWLVLTVRDDAEWQAFCEAVGRPKWAGDERFTDVLGRHRHHDELDELIASWTREQGHIEAMHLLQAAGVTTAACSTRRRCSWTRTFGSAATSRRSISLTSAPGRCLARRAPASPPSMCPPAPPPPSSVSTTRRYSKASSAFRTRRLRVSRSGRSSAISPISRRERRSCACSSRFPPPRYSRWARWPLWSRTTSSSWGWSRRPANRRRPTS